MTAAEEKPRRTWRVRAAYGFVTGAIGFAAGAFSLGSGALDFIYDIRPDLRPDPKEKVGATLKISAVDRGVSQQEYLRRKDFPTAHCTPEQLKRLGNVFYVDAQIEGFKRSTTPLRWFVYNTDNGRRLPYARSGRTGVDDFRPQAPVDRQISQVWVPAPPLDGSFFVRFELYSGRLLLGFVDTAPFQVQTSPFESTAAPCKPPK